MTVEGYARALARLRRQGHSGIDDTVWRHSAALWHQELRRAKTEKPSILIAFARAYREALEADLDALRHELAHAKIPPPRGRASEDLTGEEATLDETAALDAATLAWALREGPLPFHGENAAPALMTPAEARAPDQAGQTATLDAVLITHPSTPFGDRNERGGRDDEVDLDATAALDLNVLSSAALPFADTPERAPSSTPVMPPHHSAGATAMVVAELLAKAPVPFDIRPTDARSNVPSPTALDEVERYASYCVDLDEDPEGPERVRERYGIGTHAAHQTLTDRWNQRLASEPGLRLRFAEAARKYRACLRTRTESMR